MSEGFSTITMQVVRNAFVPRLAQQRSFRRKLIEIYLAHRLERALTKQQILALYLNVIYLGQRRLRRRGREPATSSARASTASRVAEGATLAALARGPSVYAPATASRSGAGPAEPRPHRHGARALSERQRRRAGPGDAAPALARRVAAARGPLVRARPGARRRRFGARRRPARRPHRVHHTRRAGRSAPPRTPCGARRTRSTAAACRWPERGRAPAATPCRARWWRSIRGTASSGRSSAARRYVPRRLQPRAGGPAAAGVRLQAVRLRGRARRRDDAGRGHHGHADRDHRYAAVSGARSTSTARTPAASRCGARSCAPPTPPPCGWARPWASVGWRRSPAAPGSGARSTPCRPWRSAPAR